MIKNAVFDFGQVMVRFSPEYMVGRYIKDKQLADRVVTVLFDRLYWDRLDAGTIEDEEVIRLSCQRLEGVPEKTVADIYNNWMYNIPEIEGMAQLVRDIKEKYGIRVFLLSNISKGFASKENEIPVLSLFEKRIYSSVCGHCKPSKEIFEYLCNECGIVPQETVFIDDSEKNIRGARDHGIEGYLFDGDAEKLRQYFMSILKV